MSSAVNRPTNTKLKEEDINQKLQLYGIYSAFALGKAPSNKQIDVALNSFLASKPIASPSGKLSEEGRLLVADFRNVVEQAKHLFLSKNDGNLLQDFIWQCQQITSGDAKLPQSALDKATAQQHGNQALDGMRTLGTLIISNGQFRKLLSDAAILVRDVAGDAATTAASRLSPSEERLAQIDSAAPDNTWHDVPSVAELKGQARDIYDKNRPFSKKDAQEASAQVQSADNTQAGAQAAADNLNAKARENVPQQTQDQASKSGETARLQARNYVSKKMPKERREQTIWRLKKMVVEIQNHPDYEQAIETLLTLAETYGGHGKDFGQQGAGTVKGFWGQNKSVLTPLKVLIERFANSTSTDDLWDSFNLIYQDAQRDPELRNWFSSVDTYIRKCLQQTGYIMEDASNDEGNRLYDQGRFLLRERYRDHTNRVLDEIKFLSNQFEEDPQNKAFGDSMQKLFNDLGNDESGKPVFKKHLVKDLSSVILPAAFERVRYVPIPRIEYSDPMVDAIIENLVVESDNLMPNSLEITSDNYFRWGRKTVKSAHKNKVEVAVSGVQMDLRDVSYYVKRKEGFPSLTDKGILDLFFGGTGLSFKVGLETVENSDKAHHFFKVSTVKVDISNLKIKMKQSNHKLLFNFAKPLLLRAVKPALLKVIEKQIRETITKGDAYAWEIQQEVDRAAEDAKSDPENAANIFQRYYTAMQNRIAQGKEQKAQQVKAKVDNTKANVAITQQDSIFKNVSLPGGISTKATEYNELAHKGDKWESPVFGIGSAAESTNLKKPAAVTRKPHNVTTAALREAGSGSATGGGAFENSTTQAFNNQSYTTNTVTTTSTTNGVDVGKTNGTTLGANNPVVTGVQ